MENEYNTNSLNQNTKKEPINYNSGNNQSGQSYSNYSGQNFSGQNPSGQTPLGQSGSGQNATGQNATGQSYSGLKYTSNNSYYSGGSDSSIYASNTSTTGQVSGTAAGNSPYRHSTTNPGYSAANTHTSSGNAQASSGTPYTSSGPSHNPSGTPNASSGNNGKTPTKASSNTKHSTIGGTLAKTAAIAAVFGLVAGGAFQGVNLGVEKLRGTARGNDDTSISEDYSEVDDENDTDYADNSVSDEAGTEADTEDSTEIAQQPITEDKDSSKNVQIANQGETSTLSYDVSGIVATAQPSIVSITTTVTKNYQYFFQNYEQDSTGAGSGIIIGQSDDTLYIATNYHVVEGAKEIKVGFNDGEIVDAVVKGYDNSADIAVVMVKLSDMADSTKSSITVASVGDSDNLQVGEPAIAIGNALGYGQSVTVGYISALNRTIEDSEGTFIQTDAAINPGNSGGALINSKGQVIGINSVKYVDSSVEGMGFSIPINSAMVIINDIIEDNQAGNTYLGISGADISREYAQIYGFPAGIYVKEVSSGSPADIGGLHNGDIIVEFDGNEVYTNEELQTLIRGKHDGDTVEVKVYRADVMGSYEQISLTVTLSAEP